MERAARLGVGLPALCVAADVRASTVYRWLNGGGVNLVTYERICARLEAEVERRELAVLADLVSRYHLEACRLCDRFMSDQAAKIAPARARA